MTHLAMSVENECSAFSVEGRDAMPQASATAPSRCSSAALNRVELHASTEAESGSSVDNVRKWQQFGLPVVPPELPPPSHISTAAPSASAQQQQLSNQQPLKECYQHGHMQPTPYSRRKEETEPGVVNTSAFNSSHAHARDLHPLVRGRSEERVNVSTSLHRRCSRADRLPTVAAKTSEEFSVHAKELTFIEVVDDDDDRHRTPPPSTNPQAQRLSGRLTCTLSALHDRLPASSIPLKSSIASSTDGKDTVSAEAVRHLQFTLAQLSEKVQHSTEGQRCGPPKRSGGGSGGGGGKTPWVSTKWGSQASSRKKTRDKADQHHGDGNEDIANETAAATAPDATQREDAGEGTKGRPTRKRGRTATIKVASDNTRTKAGGKCTRTAAGKPSNDSSSSVPRTLFSFSTSNAGGDVGEGLAGLQGAPTAASTVSVPFFYLQSSTEDLFNDIRRTLNDPDRIQAPPLFVGISTLVNDSGGGLPLVECRTNFTYHSSASKTVKGRASSCLSSIDPIYSHRHVELVMARWKDAVYALPAQTVGFPFLCRVLVELPGVELITFNAQVVLVALLAYCKGTLWSHCISDVRVMAWTAQLHIGCTPAQTQRSAFAFPRAGVATAGDGVGDANMNVLYNYDQLLLRVLAGKPPPSVLLDKANASDSSSASTPLHAAHSFAAPPSTSAEAHNPPLTPAQRLLAQQVYYLATVYRSLYGLLGSKGLLQAFLRQEKRIALLLALMRYNGIGVDLNEVNRYQKACEAEMTRQRNLAAMLVPEMGDDFNIQSHDQCRRALYEVLQLGKFLTAKTPGGGELPAGSGLTITKGGRLSTAEDTLRALAPHHEFPACLLKYRKASKLMQTYVEGMMGYAILRSEKASTDSTGASIAAAASMAGSPVWPVSSDNSIAQTEQQLLGETAAMNDTNSPFVDLQLNAGREVNTCAGGHFSGATKSPGYGNSRPKVDEEASVIAIGDHLLLPGCGYATIHPNFLQEGTDTGRLSCVEPNLQNLPRNGATSMATISITADGDEGEEDLLGFRRCFVAPAGSALLSVDYQQIELRVLAHLCGDKALIAALTQSTDIHRAIAEIVFRKKPVSSEERTLAKRVVFGVLYGAGPKTLSVHMGVSVERALHITSLLTNAFPGIEAYHRRVIEESRANGFVRTISGRLRYLPDIQSTVMSRRSYAERQAFNSVVQGSAADVMKMAMLAVAKEVLQQYSCDDVCLLSQIHDEMVFSVRKALLPTVVPLISSAMTHAMHLLVPLSVTVKFGHSLGELKEWSVEHDLGLGVDG
ncbi:putative mitochondrial DNA polymerase I protein A [Leptomonas seymouri]|uniref:DNA-directed DNA polymerase n=1 Tax=Leptomonas seymouri TaxID=5684 RepID=A0A0N1I668_LEPSE|nr:putative mitochondrial DNA polymerase I protein A [Leptomonas seymouri]|eukprot:KPI87488.1 putative mitochondrial DNA polymerase I protein A [Leptomonas seymouri]